MENDPPPRQTGLLLILIVALLAAAVKVAWAFNSFGSVDAILFWGFGQAITKSGLAEVYRSDPMFNHTPMTGMLARGLYAAAAGDFQTFSTSLRLLCVLADLAVVGTLLYVRRLTGRPPWWALVLFAASPVSLMVSGFHGNVDPLMVICLFGAAAAVIADRPILCGVLYAASCNVKIVPILLAPFFLSAWWTVGGRARLRFAASTVAVMLLGAAWPLLYCPEAYLHKVFGYGTYWGTWGFTYWLHQTGAADFATISFRDLSPAQLWIAFALKCLMVIGVLAFAWQRRAVARPELLVSITAAFTVVFIFAPGVGPQYLIWLAPFLVWSAPRWFAAVTAASAAFMFAFYHSTSQWEFPWKLALPRGWEIDFWGPWMNLPWLAFIALLFWKGGEWWRAGATAKAAGSKQSAD